MNRGIIIVCASCVVLHMLTGCASTEDVTKNSNYPTDYVQGQVYKLKQPAFIVWSSPSYCIMLPDTFHDVPPSIETYRRGGKQEWPRVKAYLAAGTRIQFHKLLMERDFSMGIFFYVLGEIVDPPEKGMEVDLLFVSRWLGENPTPAAPKINPNILESTD